MVLCCVCNKSFNNKSNVNRHLKKFHPEQQSVSLDTRSKLRWCHRCVDCSENFQKKRAFLKHLIANHDFAEDIEERDFYSKNDWLKGIEAENHVEYSRRRGEHKGKEHSLYYYECNRSGMVRNNRDKRKRNQKSQGSQKIGYMCTSHITAKVNNLTNAVHVKYLRTHYGHDIQLQHIRIPQSAKYSIANKLVLGFTVSDIINSVRDNTELDALQRVDLLSRKDVHNIKKSFKIDIDDTLHPDNATNLSLWVQECLKDTKNPILFYKPQATDDEKFHLNFSDFCIVVMNKLQMSALKRFANKFVCIDSISSVHLSSFELVTLMVSNDFDEGVPVAFMISNRKDIQIYEIFFNIIKTAVGTVDTDTFMSNITDVPSTAWGDVMGAGPNKLYCSWHIDQAWNTNLKHLVSDCVAESVETKREDVCRILKVLQTMLDADAFKIYFEEFLIQMQTDPDVKTFYEYFVSNYKDNIKSWAHCFRKELLIRTNMYLESMHCIIKYEYLEGKRMKRFDKCLHNLLRYTRSKVIKGNNAEQLNAINTRHRAATDLQLNVVNIESEEDVQYVRWSMCNPNKDLVYIITEKSSSICCSLACQTCQVCYHSVSCTCKDYSIKSNICKHIHFIYINKFGSFTSKDAGLLEIECEEEETKSPEQNLTDTSEDTIKLQDTVVNASLELVSLSRQCFSKELLATAFEHIEAINLLLKTDDAGQ